jgi:hypothetical protein
MRHHLKIRAVWGTSQIRSTQATLNPTLDVVAVQKHHRIHNQELAVERAEKHLVKVLAGSALMTLPSTRRPTHNDFEVQSGNVLLG